MEQQDKTRTSQEGEKMIKYLVMWTVVTLYQIPCSDSNLGKPDKYGIVQNIGTECAVLHMKESKENKYQIFTSTQEFRDFMGGMRIEDFAFGLGSHIVDFDVYDITYSTPMMSSFKGGK